MVAEVRVKTFRAPTSRAECEDLQRETTELLRQHRRLVAINKLCPKRMTAAQREAVLAQFDSDRDLIAAAGQPEQETARKYRNRGRRYLEDAIAGDRDIWALVAERSNTRDSWYTARAAAHFYLLEAAVMAKRAIDAWYRAAATKATTDDLRVMFLQATKLLPAVANAIAATPFGGPPEKFQGSGKSKRPVNSKSASIRNVPDDWRVQVANGLGGSVKLLYLLQCVTGCRPAELKKGVAAVRKDDGNLEFTVMGAKVGKHSGQQERHIVVAASDGVALELRRLLSVGSPVQSRELIGKVNTYCKAVARCGKKLFPEKKTNKQLTAYSARHQYKNDIRDAGLSREEIAKAMGHATTKSSSYYGTRVKSGGGAVKPRSVNATRKVKVRSAHPNADRALKVRNPGAVSPAKPRARPGKP